MKQFILGLSLVAALIVRADDSYLYWLVDNDSSMYKYDTVKVAAVNQSWDVNYLTLTTENFDELGTSISQKSVGEAADLGFGFYAKVLQEYASDSYSFFVELWNGDEVVANSGTGKSWSSVQDMIYRNAMNMGTGETWTTSTSTFQPGAIPEPTSGMMVLLGMAALALRRRRRA